MKKTTLLITSILCTSLPSLFGQEIELYSTDFSEFTVGEDELVGQDGWGSLDIDEGLHGIDSDILEEGSGNSAFIGYNTPSDDFVSVWKTLQYDPIAEGTPLLHFSGDIAIFDSDNDFYDNFYVSIWNSDIEFLASINFDNTTEKIYRQSEAGQFDDLDVSFETAQVYNLAFTIDFASNIWSATLDTEALFTNAAFHTGGHVLDVESIDFEWAITDIDTPGNNWMFFDNIHISASEGETVPDEDPTIQTITLNQDGNPEITWATQADIQYQVQFSDNLRTWSNDLPNSTFTGPADGSNLSYQDATADLGTDRYYRVTTVD